MAKPSNEQKLQNGLRQRIAALRQDAEMHSAKAKAATQAANELENMMNEVLKPKPGESIPRAAVLPNRPRRERKPSEDPAVSAPQPPAEEQSSAA